MGELTVIIPMYNAEAYIEECIRSIIKQGDPVADIIIINDGSTDNGEAICKKLTACDSRISIISRENKGLSEARHTGIINCKTKYVTFVDADDFILEHAYDTAIEPMSDDVDMIVHEIARYYGPDKIRYDRHIIQEGRYDRRRIEKEVYPKLIWDFDRNCGGVDCSLCVRIIKTSLLKDMYTNLKSSYYYGEDAAIVYPLYKRIKNMMVINKCYYMHRQRIGSVASYIESDNFFDSVSELHHLLSEEFKDEGMLLKKQIDYFCLFSFEQRKRVYGDFDWHPDYLFPFDKIPSGRNLVLYGAGNVGKAYYRQLKKLNYCSKLLWVDKNYLELNMPDVKDPEEIADFDYDFIVIGIENTSICNSIKKRLVEEMHVDELKVLF